MSEQDNHPQIYESRNDDGETVMREFHLYSPRQESRLTTFHNMLNRVMETEATMKQTGKANHFGEVNRQTGKVTDSYIELDRRFTSIWKEQAQNLYESEFRGDPLLEQAAVDIRNGLRQTYDEGPAAKSAEELGRIWEIQDELRQMGGDSHEKRDHLP